MTSGPGGPGWRIDPETLLPEILDMAVFQAALADDPCREVLTALWGGDARRALGLVTELLTTDPGNPRLLTLQADCWRDIGDLERARRQLDGLVATYAGSEREAVLVQHLGKTLFVARRYGEAAECFARALRLREGAGGVELIASSRLALERSQTLAATPDNVAGQ